MIRLAEEHDERLLPWLYSPPQTNEAGRSASVMAGLLWLSRRIGSRFELNEIGASAGINTMMGRYFYDLGGVRAGAGGLADADRARMARLAASRGAGGDRPRAWQLSTWPIPIRCCG